MRKCCAFTLIELLVVISIIALLIAMLMPTLSKVREPAQNAQSLANMHGLMQAQIAYATDNAQNYASSGEWIWGKGNLNDHPKGKKLNGSTNFSNHNNDFTTQEAPAFGVLVDYVSDFNAHFCPLAGRMPVTTIKGGSPKGDRVERSYTMNWNVGKNWVPRYNGYFDEHTPETITSPRDLVVIGEENTFTLGIRPGREAIMNDGAMHQGWDHWGSNHNLTGGNLRSGYSAAAFADGRADWIFAQARENGVWASEAFGSDDIENPEQQDPRYIKQF